MSTRDKTLQALAMYDGGHNQRVAAFPPFPPKNQNAPPPGAPTKRDIPSNHPFEPKALKPMSKALYACSVALGNALTAYREFSRVKSATVSPDGLLGGRGYVMGVRDMRQKMWDACEALSAIADTLHDEINAPHWKPKLALLDDNDQEDVARFVEESEDVLENPEEEAEEKIEEIEKANDGPKKGKPVAEEETASKTPGGGDAEVAQTKEASGKQAGGLELDVSMLRQKLNSLVRQLKAGESVPVDYVVTSLLQDIKVMLRQVGHSSIIPLEVGGYLREIQDYLQQALRRPEASIKALQRAWGDAKELDALFAAGVRRAACEGGCGCGGPRVENREPEGGPGPFGSWTEDDAPPADNWEADEGGAGRRDDFGEDYDYPSEWENETAKTAGHAADRALRAASDWLAASDWADSLAADVWAQSTMPDESMDDTETDAWDFGLGFGARGQGAGNYANPQDDDKDGVWGPRSGLPGVPDQSSGDTVAPIEESINRRAFTTREEVGTWIWEKSNEYGGKLAFLSSDEYREAYDDIAKLYAESVTPGDAAGPPARADYYDGPKDNLVQAESEAWAESVLPDAPTAGVDHEVVDISDTLYVHEDTATPYDPYDDKSAWPQATTR